MKTLLVVMPSWIGDIVMATPVLRALKAAGPERRLVTTVRPGLDGVLAGLDCIDEIEVANLRGVLGPVSDARRLRLTIGRRHDDGTPGNGHPRSWPRRSRAAFGSCHTLRL